MPQPGGLGPAMLEGERVHRAVRPHPLARLDDYAPGLALLLLAALLGGGGVAAWLAASTGGAALVLLAALWWALLGFATLPFAARRHGLPLVGYALLLAVVGGLAAASAGGTRSAAAALALVSAGGAVPLLAWAELRRRADRWLLTTFRVVHLHGWPRRRQGAWMLRRLDRVAVRPRAPRFVGVADLVLEGPEDVRLVMRGMPRPERVRDELELLLHTEREAPYLGDQRHVVDEVMHLLRPEDATRR